MTDEPVSRGEFDLLRQIVTANQARLDLIDLNGTKGVAVVQAQLVEVVRDITELKAEVNARFDAHQRVHDRDQAAQTGARRYALTTTVAVLALLVTILALLIARR